jgi:type II secretory ATPase GspE/PulE/Tfp pilus assembly ATPase PilB-like protein
MIRRQFSMPCVASVILLVTLGAFSQSCHAAGTPVSAPALPTFSNWTPTAMAVAAPTPLPFKQAAAKTAEEKRREAIAKARPGGYLSVLKLGLIAGVFLFWVWWVDWINRDALQLGKKLKMQPEFWNPIIVLSFLVGLAIVMFVPIFWAGYPVFVLAALLPPILYTFTRRSRIKNDKSAASAVKNKGNAEHVVEMEEELPQDEGADVSFSTGGADANEKQARLIRARQSPEFPILKDLMYDAQFKRAEQIMFDCAPNGAKVRILVDGIWHPFPPLDRPTADGVVNSIKALAGLDATNRRITQTGTFDAKSDFGKSNLRVRTQGTPTGERVLMKVIEAKKDIMKLGELGMFPDMIQPLCDSMNHAGITIISSPPGHGLTSSWQGAIFSSDRLTRDISGFYKPDEVDTDIENIMPKPYDPSKGETSIDSLKKILLSQPDAVIVPEVDDSETMDLLTLQATTQDRAIMFRAEASSAAEAFLKMYAKSKDREQFLQAMRNATCQRLLRRLCPACRVEVRVKPQMIQKLGGNPTTQGTVFNQFQLPPPAQRVDENGNPIEFPPCETCGGIGYIGRVAVFELLTFDDRLRDVVRKQPQTAAIESAALKLGKKSLTQQAYKLVLLGVTSLAEVQRIFKPASGKEPAKRSG